MTTAYPLSWPQLFPRSKRREKSRFRTTIAGAIQNVQNSLELFGRDSGKKVTDIVLSSNVTLGEQRPSDPGVAVYFNWDGLPVCIPVDRYESVEENLQAVHHIIEARRTELRHGSLQLVRASFTGFTALPPPSDGHWSDVLGVSRGATAADIERAYRSKAKKAHPDTGGSEAAMTELNNAKTAALRELAH
ncbi:MAG: J domain-containing protein [Pseudomonadota bacterium]